MFNSHGTKRSNEAIDPKSLSNLRYQYFIIQLPRVFEKFSIEVNYSPPISGSTKASNADGSRAIRGGRERITIFCP